MKQYTLEYLFPEEDEVPGFSIKLRQLTEEEYKQDITLERIQDFHHEVGEDLLDTTGYVCNNLNKLVSGYLMCKYPHLASQINEASNEELLSVCHVIDDYFEDGGDTFYSDFCTVVNYTELTKARINQILIQTTED